MADLVTIATLKAANLATLNNSVPDESIDPSDHNQTMIDTIDTLTNGVILQNALVSGTSIKTVNTNNLLGAGNITIVENATHTSEVTGSTALTLDKTAISNKTLVTLAPTDHVLIGDTSDSDNLKKVLASDFGSAGKVAAYDANGKPTFFDTLQLALNYAGTNSISVVHLQTDLKVVNCSLVEGVSINLNGFTIFNDNNGAENEHVLTGGSSTWSGFIINGKIRRTGRPNGSTGRCFNLQVLFCDFSGCKVENTFGEASRFTGVADSLVVNLHSEGRTVGIESSINITNCYGFGRTLWGINLQGGYGVRCLGESVDVGSSGIVNFGSLGFIDSIGRSVNGIGVGSGGGGTNNYLNCQGYSVSSRAAISVSELKGGIYQTQTGVALDGVSKAQNLIAASGSNRVFVPLNANNRAINCTFTSGGNVVCDSTPVAITYSNCTIINDWDNVGGHGILAYTGAIIDGCKFFIRNATANAINSTNTFKWLNNSFPNNLTNPVSLTATQGMINTHDAQGNIQI